MDDRQILAEAYAKRERAVAEVEKLTAFINTLLELRPSLRSPEHNKLVTTPAIGHVSAGATVQAQGFARSSIIETEAATIKIIRECGRSLKTKDLLPLLENAGISVGGKDPLATLSARLSRSTKLQNVRPNGWTIINATSPITPVNSGDFQNPSETLPNHVFSQPRRFFSNDPEQ